jgi:hypothetical protein
LSTSKKNTGKPQKHDWLHNKCRISGRRITISKDARDKGRREEVKLERSEKSGLKVLTGYFLSLRFWCTIFNKKSLA